MKCGTPDQWSNRAGRAGGIVYSSAEERVRQLDEFNSFHVGGSVTAVFVDRDGVIIRKRDDYVKSLSEVKMLPGAAEALAALSRAGHTLVLVTNQSAIARGLVSMAIVDRIHARIRTEVEALGGRIEAFMVCPHLPDAGCQCRKPEPGLLLLARDELGIDLSSAYLIGDQLSDIQVARSVGCRPILIESPRGRVEGPCLAVESCPDLTSAARLILARLAEPSASQK